MNKYELLTALHSVNVTDVHHYFLKTSCKRIGWTVKVKLTVITQNMCPFTCNNTTRRIVHEMSLNIKFHVMIAKVLQSKPLPICRTHWNVLYDYSCQTVFTIWWQTQSEHNLFQCEVLYYQRNCTSHVPHFLSLTYYSVKLYYTCVS